MKLKAHYTSEFNSSFYLFSNFEIKIIMFQYFKNSNYSFMFYFMFSCIYPNVCIAYNITSSDRSIGHYLQTLLFYVGIPISHSDLLYPV